MQQFTGQIEGEFTGFNDGAIFKLTNGQVWQQSRYKYLYHYAYRPHVRIYRSNSGAFLMEVEGIDEPVEVMQVGIVTEGHIISDFKGYKHGATFEFQNGQVWEQKESKYKYHYAYRPQAYIISGIYGLQMYVEGMSESVKVRKT